jgi:hypothetical protein
MANTASAQQPGLRKELGLGDLVMAQVLCVVGSSWVGIAAKLGRAHVVESFSFMCRLPWSLST